LGSPLNTGEYEIEKIDTDLLNPNGDIGAVWNSFFLP
jgi:hypothetical protein